MRTLYTMVFQDFLDDYELTPEWQSIKTTFFAKFPDWYVQGVRDSSGTITNVSMSSLYDLFVDKYNIQEIGGETPDLFVHAVRDKIQELVIKYLPKVAILNQVLYSVDSTTKKSEALMNRFEMITTDDYADCGYIYPINATSSKMSGKTTNQGTKTQKIPLSQSSWAEITKEILSLPDVYNQIINELGSCFMQIL